MRPKITCKQKKVVTTSLIILLFFLFIAIINCTIHFSLFTFDDIRLGIILVSCTGILILIGHIDFKAISIIKKRIRFNLFFTAMIMSVLLLFNTFSTTIDILSHRHMIMVSFKPLLLAFLFYLPIVNLLERLEHLPNLATDPSGSKKSESESLKGKRQMTLALLGLSRREREVFELALHDLSNKEIADKLFIAEATVKNICKTF